MQKILLTLEFLVLGGALFSLFVKSQLNRKSRFGVAPKRRYAKVLPEPIDRPQARPLPGMSSANVGKPRNWPNAQPAGSIRIVQAPASEAMNALVDCLVREKNLVPRKPSDSRINVILNAFLEQRKVPLEARLPLRPDTAL